MRLFRRFFSLIRWFVFLLFLAMVPGLIIVFSTSKDTFDAALTRPQLIVKKHPSGASEIIYCVCERTLRQDEIPQSIRDALIAAEDKRFFSPAHIGVDLKGLARGVIFLGKRGGGSSIHQQLAKRAFIGTYGSGWRRLFRKYQEVMFALRIAATYSKEDVLSLYLSRVDFGTTRGIQIVGLRTASRVYFGQPAKNLNAHQGAILVGMLKATHAYNPVRRPFAARARAETVLTLVNRQFLQKHNVKSVQKFMPNRFHTRAFRDRYIEDHLKTEFDSFSEGFEPGYYRVISSIDPIAQYNARRILARELARSSRRNVTRAALVTLDQEGRVLALVGGLDYTFSTFNIATKGHRQAASTAKLVTYLTALEQGWHKNDTLHDTRKRIKGPFVPRNYDNTYRGKISLEQCFAQSRNVCTMWLSQQLKDRDIETMAVQLGLANPGVRASSIVLGAAETTLLRNTAGFASLNMRGTVPTPSAVRAILGPFGTVYHSQKIEKSTPLYGAETRTNMRTLLSRVVNEGTGKNAIFRGGTAFGKTGTSQENRDAWFVGFTGDGITTGVWVGAPENQTMTDVSGGTVPARIFANYNVNLVERFRAHVAGEPLPR